MGIATVKMQLQAQEIQMNLSKRSQLNLFVRSETTSTHVAIKPTNENKEEKVKTRLEREALWSQVCSLDMRKRQASRSIVMISSQR